MKKTILVVEDDTPLMEAVQMKLEKCGFRVVTARSVESAMGTKILEIDGIWLDHNLIGKENGIDFVVQLKAKGGKFKDIPIFVVSNTSSLDLRKSYANLGVLNYFVKAEHKLGELIKQVQNNLRM